MRGFFAFLLLFPGAVLAESVGICYNYGCAVEAVIEVAPSQLEGVQRLLARADDAASERLLLAEAVSRLYRIAGVQTPIWRDRGGNYADDGVEGRMDCIDHSMTTSRFLALLASKGWLRFHVPQPRQMRRRGLIFDHWTAVIREQDSGEEFAVDRWFFDYGEAPAVIPIAEWQAGKDPDIMRRVADAVQEQTMERQVSQ